MAAEFRVVLAGDVMTGRGIDQVLAHPLPPELHEGYVHDARTYVTLAERVNGAIPRAAEATWPWGEALPAMDGFGPAVRVLNLETSVTESEEWARGKAVTYRMSPANLDVVTEAHADVWALANNHVLDYGRSGLLETLRVMAGAGLRTTGAGRDEHDAWRPAVVELGEGQRVLVLGVGDTSSGVPSQWAAGAGRPGVALLPDLSRGTAHRVAERLLDGGRLGDLRVVSIHWGGNWGYDVPRGHRRFAHALVDAGVHIVHGHSSHHPRPIEVYRGGLVLYGCGDLVNDYEGIGGYEVYRDDLRALYLARLDPGATGLLGLRLVPLVSRRFRLERASVDDTRWLGTTLSRAGLSMGTALGVAEEAAGPVLDLRW
jgi:poly-gamma-glutamate capsule biosynthesis protein CapA/YwtB (metallophosphatase superfamily)